MRSLNVLTFAAIAGLITGCSGGGSSTSPAAPKAPATAAPGRTDAKKQTVSITFGIPKRIASRSAVRRGKTRSYVSPAALGATLVATSTTPADAANDASYAYDLSTLCMPDAMGSGSTCALTFPLTADTYSIVVSLYDRAESDATAPAGNELGTDTETYTVAPNTDNTFDFYLLAVVQGFNATVVTSGPTPAPSSSSAAHPYVGFVGTSGRLSAPDTQVVKFSALDPSGYQIDSYSGLYGFAPAVSASSPPSSSSFGVDIADGGDTTACSSCSTVSNDTGTSTVAAPGASITYPDGGAAAPAGAGSATDENLTFAYGGGGGIGTGIESWTTATTSLTGTQMPYHADVSVADTANNPIDNAANDTAYTVAHGYIVPLYTYVTDGNGNALTSTSNRQPFYVWAGQYLPPSGASGDGSSYAVTIASPSDCEDAGGHALVAIDTDATYPQYFAHYGSVFEVTPNSGSFTGTCTLTVSDRTGGDTTTVSVAIETPGSTVGVPAPSSPPATPQPFARTRR